MLLKAKLNLNILKTLQKLNGFKFYFPQISQKAQMFA